MRVIKTVERNLNTAKQLIKETLKGDGLRVLIMGTKRVQGSM